MLSFFDAGEILPIVVNAFIVLIAVLISDKFLNRNMNIKKSSIMVAIAYLAIPYISTIVNRYVHIYWLVGMVIVPFITWIILGEILLTDFTAVEKFNVALIAFIVYMILEFVPVGEMLIGLISSYI